MCKGGGAFFHFANPGGKIVISFLDSDNNKSMSVTVAMNGGIFWEFILWKNGAYSDRPISVVSVNKPLIK